MKNSKTGLQTISAEWTDVVLVCRKCQKKLGGGFGPDGDEKLGKALRRSLAPAGAKPGKKQRKARIGVADVDCLGLCPKGAVVTIRASAPGSWLMIRGGTALDTVKERLGLI